jgi:hypothetical protein
MSCAARRSVLPASCEMMVTIRRFRSTRPFAFVDALKRRRATVGFACWAFDRMRPALGEAGRAAVVSSAEADRTYCVLEFDANCSRAARSCLCARMREVVTLEPAKYLHRAIRLFAPRLYLDDRGGEPEIVFNSDKLVDGFTTSAQRKYPKLVSEQLAVARWHSRSTE